MFCSECGTKNEVGSKFCNKCGKPLSNNVKNLDSEKPNLIARRLAEKQKEVQIVKGTNKTKNVLKMLSAFLFVIGSAFVMLSFYFATIPFIVCCIVWLNNCTWFIK